MAHTAPLAPPATLPSIGRSAGAVFAGLLAVVILSTATDAVMHAGGVYPPAGQPMAEALFLLATAYRCVYGVLGGWVSARLAPSKPLNHAIVLGAIGLVLSALGAAATWNRGPEFGPHWYPLLLVATAVPLSWAGGKLYERQIRDA